MHNKHLESLEQVDCDICDATGKRQEPPETGAGDRECNGCNGKGERKPFIAGYPFDANNVRDFAHFCEKSGGFEIC